MATIISEEGNTYAAAKYGESVSFGLDTTAASAIKYGVIDNSVTIGDYEFTDRELGSLLNALREIVKDEHPEYLV